MYHYSQGQKMQFIPKCPMLPFKFIFCIVRPLKIYRFVGKWRGVRGRPIYNTAYKLQAVFYKHSIVIKQYFVIGYPRHSLWSGTTIFKKSLRGYVWRETPKFCCGHWSQNLRSYREDFLRPGNIKVCCDRRTYLQKCN